MFEDKHFWRFLSIKGDVSFINEYLSNLSLTHSDISAWLAPIKINNQKCYAWVIGHRQHLWMFILGLSKGV